MSQIRLCGNEYERPEGRERGDRMVHCDLPASHNGDHVETLTQHTWPVSSRGARRPVYEYLDRVNGVELAATTYPYGGGLPGRGLQITEINGLTVLAARMPADDAIALARAILDEFADINDDGALLQPHDVARMFHVDTHTVSRWASAGRIPSIRTLGGHRRYRLADVQAALEANNGSARRITAPAPSSTRSETQHDDC